MWGKKQNKKNRHFHQLTWRETTLTEWASRGVFVPYRVSAPRSIRPLPSERVVEYSSLTEWARRGVFVPYPVSEPWSIRPASEPARVPVPGWRRPDPATGGCAPPTGPATPAGTPGGSPRTRSPWGSLWHTIQRPVTDRRSAASGGSQMVIRAKKRASVIFWRRKNNV